MYTITGIATIHCDFKWWLIMKALYLMFHCYRDKYIQGLKSAHAPNACRKQPLMKWPTDF